MFEKILIANRGEIACRVIRTCRRLGIKTAVIYSEADKDCLHVKLADEAYPIGPPEPEKSYLRIDKIIDVAKACDAEAVHPGYGFLAERADFAKACEKEGIKFIGPTSETLEKLKNKTEARRLMEKAGIEIIPGSENSVENFEDARCVAKEIGFPVLVKATYGGGGRGLRVAKNEEELKKIFEIAKEEAKTAFGKPEIYIEKYLEKPRHVEFQILADEHGNIIHLGERECSIQRRYQKLLEETPSPALNEELREKMGEVAIKAAKACGYTNAGTIEFLLKNGKFYFLEVNKRIQVEHLITELVTGIDLVEQQIRIAGREKLGIKQKTVSRKGWAMNCRINCEDPKRNFLPSPGKITRHRLPVAEWIRVDTHLYEGYKVPYYYDPLIAKVAVIGKDRKEVIKRMKYALENYVIEGVPTTIPFHLSLLENQNFLEGNYYVGLVEKIEELSEIAAISAALAFYYPAACSLTFSRIKRRKSKWTYFGRRELMEKNNLSSWKWM